MKIDIIGCGAAVQTIHLPVLRRLQEESQLSVRGCFDTNPIEARKVARHLRASAWGSPDKIRELSLVDGALISTPPGVHVEIASRYMSEGRHVLIEKPLATNREAAKSIVALSETSGARALVGHFRRFFPGLQAAKRFLASGALKGVSRICATEGARWNWASRSRYVVESPDGGVIYDTGSHLIDMVLYLLGLDAERSDVSFGIKSLRKQPPTEPSHECMAVLELRTGAGMSMELTLKMSRTQALAGAITVHAENGTLMVPTTFSTDAQLLACDERFFVNAPSADPLPSDVTGCFTMEHAEFSKVVRDPGCESTIDCNRFMLLTGILETLAASA